MLMKNLRIIIALLAVMAVMVMIPVSVYAAQESGPIPYEDPVQTKEAFSAQTQDNAQNKEKTIVTQEFKYKKGETPDIPNKINQFGQVLTLASVSDPVESASLPENRTYTYQVSKTYTPEQLSQAPGNVKVTPVYGYGRRQVDRKETITGLSSNDVDMLSARKIYTDTNGRGPGAKEDGELVLAEVKYEVEHRDEHGIPDRYTAHVVYRGEESFEPLMHYTAVATYTGTETIIGEPSYTVVATYEGDAPAATETAELPPGVPDAEMTDPYAAAGSSESKSGFARLFSLGRLLTLGSLSKTGIATLAAVAAAILTIVIIGIYNKRRVRESSQA